MNKYNAAHERNAASLLALHDLLRLIIRQPALFAENQAVTKALKSQGAIAALEISFEEDSQQKRKEKMSVNTLKSHSSNVFEQGFEGLDALRIAAAEKIEAFKLRLKSSNKRTKDGLTKRTSELEFQIQQLQCINMVLLQGISNAISTLRSIRQDVKPQLVEKRASDEVDALLALLSINPPPFNSPPLDTRNIKTPSQEDSSAKVSDMSDYRK